MTQQHGDGIPFPEERQSCIHHWIIDVKNLGICKKCGDMHQFCSSWEQAANGRTWTRSYGNARSSIPNAENR